MERRQDNEMELDLFAGVHGQLPILSSRFLYHSPK